MPRFDYLVQSYSLHTKVTGKLVNSLSALSEENVVKVDRLIRLLSLQGRALCAKQKGSLNK